MMAIVKVLPDAVNGKNLAFDSHAVHRMEDRGISEEEVIATLEDPDVDNLRADEPHKRSRKFFNKGTVKVRGSAWCTRKT